MNGKKYAVFYKYCIAFSLLVLFGTAFYPGQAAARPDNAPLALKNVSVSQKDGEYFIWFAFNRNPEKLPEKVNLKKYGMEIGFGNTSSLIGSNFIKFSGNRLYKAAEVMPSGNGLKASVYFRGSGRGIKKDDVYVTEYGRYFIVKIKHVFFGKAFSGSPSAAASSLISKKGGGNGTGVSAVNANSQPEAGSKKGGLKPGHLSSGMGSGLDLKLEAVKTLVYLAIIIGLIYGVYFLLGKIKKRVSVREKVNSLKVLSSVNVGNKKSILLIEVNGELFVVGVSHSGIQVIGRLGSGNADVSAHASEIAGSFGIQADSESADFPAADPGIYGQNHDAANAPLLKPGSPVSAVKSYGKFSDIFKDHIGGGKVAQQQGPAGDETIRDAAAAFKSDSFKVKNINDAKFKNKSDSVFFDIEERLKGLMESNVGSKKF